ncbi:MAG: serine/threonine-protein kinase [Bryobacterales bacterium]|nr:serine/threonine-protein kinase [Bryobacterales bacterium]
MVGKTISHYEILEKLGEGGMGIVYKARDTHLDRPVALKLLPASRMADPDRKRRFIQEAKAASALNHPNIITIYDTDQADGLDFISMEFVPGKTLDQVIPRKGLPLTTTLQYAVQMADALAAAHNAGIVHRDFKPGNVMVTDQGKVKVLDFGLAKLTEAAPLGPDAETRTLQPATEDGAIVGTVAYMSPEQAQGKHIDARSDIFSFGSVLYEMVAGRRAFQGDSKIATLAAIIERDPAPLPTGVPHDVDKLISRCLRKDPARRMQTMADLRVAVEELKENSEPGRSMSLVLPRTRHARSGAPWMLALVLLAVAAAALWIGMFSRPPLPKAMVATPLTSYPGLEGFPTISPDGTQIAFSWNGEQQDNFDIYVQVVGSGGSLRRTTDPSLDFSPAWSPDGRYLAYLRSRPNGMALMLAPPLAGPERMVAELDFPMPLPASAWGSLLAWTPDGKWVAYPDRSAPLQEPAVFILSVETGERRRLTAPPPNTRDLWPSFSPRGDILAFVRWSVTHVGEVYLLALTDEMMPQRPPEQLTFESRVTVTPAWSADGRDLLYSTGSMRSRALRRVSATNRVRPAETLALLGEIVDAPVLSVARRRLVFRQASVDENIWRIESGGPPSRHPVSSSRNEQVPQFSPDGKRIVFTSDRSGRLAVWVSNRDGSSPQQLTSLNATMTGCPRWSPDGKWIVFDSNAEGQYEVYSISSNGGSPRRLTNNSANDAVASFSRDGKWIYFMSNRTGAPQIWKMPFAGGDAVQVTAHGGYVALESHDGKTLYYSQAAGTSSLWKIPLEGGEEIQMFDGITFLNFTVMPNGIFLIAPGNDTNQRSIEFFDFGTRKMKTLAAIGRPITNGLSVSPDGRTILYAQQDQLTSDLMLVENFR